MATPRRRGGRGSARGRLRIIAGEAGGRRLVSPPGARPTTDRVRESVFGALGPAVADVAVLDLYAGSGALALEALSRGASSAVLVECDPDALEAVRANVAALGMGARARVLARPVAAVLAEPPMPEAPFGMVCCDPPYETGDEEVAGVLRALEAPGWLAAGARVVVERPARSQAAGSEPVWPPGWALTWRRGYGDTLVVALQRAD